jgi:processive 1,2-diacylglycerol beta-glucosyltransferase
MKILILSETFAGSGHVVAARNIAKGIKTIYPEANIKMDSAFPKVSPFLEKWTGEAYMKTIRHASTLWGWAYQRDKEWSFVGKRLLSKIVASRLHQYLHTEKPDIVICTHAFCLGGLCELKKNPTTPPFLLAASLTDYCINHFWVFDEVDYYFVGSESIKQRMMHTYGIKSSRIYATGIPIDPQFNEAKDRALIRERHSIPNSTPLVLVSGGGLGLAPYEEILEALGGISNPLNIVVILGRNCKQRMKVENAASAIRHPTLIFDYVENMSEWMMAADLMIGKPGGLTVSEALSCELPLLIYKPIPGQEEQNSQFLLENEVALRADGPSQLYRILAEFLSNPWEQQRIKRKLKLFGKPTAALELGRIVIKELNYQ